MDSKILEEVSCIRADGEIIPIRERIIRETALTVFVDGRHFATAMIMAALEKEYVIGNLYVQGRIENAADIVAFELEDHIARLELRKGIEPHPLPREIRSDLKIRSKDIADCVQAILTSPIFEETGAVHSAGLFLNGKETVSIAEDLGRHNALDKVIGAALLKDVDFSNVLATSTGRQPTEMILKCLHAGIPIIATKGVPTSLGVELAEKVGISIVGMVRKNSMIVYSHPERILCP
ncbi:MAG: formate dehydrogenase accessory protein [Syntrophus sp. PtaU1.Bin208]|nr:MAG: formate dehydrogenase accessory protein [Syntrophus sp. PtaU1.Bin208]